MTALELVIRESWPAGRGQEDDEDHGDLALVLRMAGDTKAETRRLDQLERANRRAMRTWLASGRSL